MAGYGYMARGVDPYNEMQSYQDDHVSRHVIVDVQGRRSPIVSYSTDHGVKGYVVRAQRIVEVRHSYDTPLNGLQNEYEVHDEWDHHSPKKVRDFFDKFHNEASRPTHPTLLSPPKWIDKPTWRSEDHGSPKYGDHRDFSGNDWERLSGSPLRNKFEGLHLKDNRESTPYSYMKDGHEKPILTHSMNSPKYDHSKDYGGNNRWDSPPKKPYGDWDNKDKLRGHDDYATNRGTSPYGYNNKDDHGKPKFLGAYKSSSPPLSQATNDIGTAMKILEQGSKPLASSTYAPQSHFPSPYSTPLRKESYPERTPGEKAFTTHASDRPSNYPKSNLKTETKEKHPEPTKGMKPLFSPTYAQEPHLPTTNPTSQRKESYPETGHGTKPLFSPVYAPQSHSPTQNTTQQRKETYPESAQETNPFFSSGSTKQQHFPSSNPTSQNGESYPNKLQDRRPMVSPVSKQQPHYPTSHSTPEQKDRYSDHETPLWEPSFAPSSPQKGKPFSSPYDDRQEPHYGAGVPRKETIDSSEARKRYSDFKPVSPTQIKYTGTIDSREAVKKYNGAFVP